MQVGIPPKSHLEPLEKSMMGHVGATILVMGFVGLERVHIRVAKPKRKH
jgi:hypothetical protein